MQNIITAVEVLAGDLLKFKGEASNAIRDIKSINERFAQWEAALIKRKEELDAREVEIKKIEDIIALKTQAEIDTKAVRKAEQELSAARNQLNRQIEAMNRQREKENEQIKSDREANANESRALIQLRKDLEKEKADFKMKIAVGLVNQATK